MIRRAVVSNFRCLASVDVSFEPMTILVGPNASGKTALIAALDPSVGLDGSNAGKPTEPLGVEIASSDDQRLTPRHLITYTCHVLHLDLGRIRAPNRVQESPLLNRDGSNLANVFATLTRSQQADISMRLTTLVPMYRDVVARPGSPGDHRLVFQDRWTPTRWYEPHQVSDGTMLLLAFLVLQYQSAPIDLLAIEEPERGLHPYLVGELVGMLRRLSTGQLGPKAIQVILATHSAELLAFAEAKEVRFLSRRETDGATEIETAPTESADWAHAVREYQGSLGGLWLSGAVGGVPSAPQ
jgi:predicted ATPase